MKGKRFIKSGYAFPKLLNGKIPHLTVSISN